MAPPFKYSWTLTSQVLHHSNRVPILYSVVEAILNLGRLGILLFYSNKVWTLTSQVPTQVTQVNAFPSSCVSRMDPRWAREESFLGKPGKLILIESSLDSDESGPEIDQKLANLFLSDYRLISVMQIYLSGTFIIYLFIHRMQVIQYTIITKIYYTYLHNVLMMTIILMENQPHHSDRVKVLECPHLHNYLTSTIPMSVSLAPCTW